MADDVAVEIDGVEWRGWKGVEIERGLEQAAGSFSLDLTDRWPGQTSPRPIRAGAAAKVSIDGETVITGFIDAVEIAYDAAAHSWRASGRDATGDLVDSSALEPFEYRDADLASVAGALTERFGIPVTVEGEPGETFKRFSIQPGETVYEAVERAARFRGFLPVSDGQGGLVLSRPGGAAAAGARLESGANILAAKLTIDHKDRHSEYHVRGQSEGAGLSASAVAASAGSWNEGAETSHAGVSADREISRYRPLLVVAESAGGQADFQQRADWQRSVLAARGVTLEVRVASWRSPAGLWRPGQVVTVSDAILALEGEMMISRVRLTKSSADGTIAELTLLPQGAFQMLAEPETDPGGWGGDS
jgi:prophage tail gpP-like protein